MEELLLNYGVLGLWTASLLFERYRHNKEMKKIVGNNTIAITKVYEVMKKCKKRQ